MTIDIETLSAEERAELQAKLAKANGDGEGFEKRYKDTQASYTKANEEKYSFAKELVEQNPKKLLTMDAKTQAKVIKDLYDVDDLDTLKIMKPELFEDGGNGEGEGDDETTLLRRKVELLELQWNKRAIEWAIDDFVGNNKDIVATIPHFKEKINDELKYISSELPAKERVKRATKLISSNNDVNIEAMLALQGRTSSKTQKQWVSDEMLLKQQNQIRVALGLKTK